MEEKEVIEVVELPLPPELASELEESFYQGPMLDERGRRQLSAYKSRTKKAIIDFQTLEWRSSPND
jgi:hypothetical protein